jgi:hypothetical protein
MVNALTNGKSITLPTGGPIPRRCAEHLLALTDAELAGVDPVEMNLLVAKGIPSLADLDTQQYQRMADAWAEDIRRRLPAAEVEFHKTPLDWKGDVRFFRLGMVCWYVDQVLGIRYREDQGGLTWVRYTDPSDLFLNGVMDTRRGTCANMATLHVALGWRLGWPVSLACAGSHFICRYDDGEVTHNIEATNNEGGGFHSHPDEFYLQRHRLPRKAITCGSDLRAVTPREMLGLFVGARARHLENTGLHEEAEADYLLARYLFPQNRRLQVARSFSSVQCSMDRFEPGEEGHPTGWARWLRDVVNLAPWSRGITPQPPQENTHESSIEAFFAKLGADRTT